MNLATVIAQLTEERDRLNLAIEKLQSLEPRTRKGRRTMSPEAKAKIGRAMRAAWKRRKGGKK